MPCRATCTLMQPDPQEEVWQVISRGGQLRSDESHGPVHKILTPMHGASSLSGKDKWNSA